MLLYMECLVKVHTLLFKDDLFLESYCTHFYSWVTSSEEEAEVCRQAAYI